MKKKTQIYWLVLRARNDVVISVEQRHSRFFERLKEIPPPWGLGERPAPSVPKVVDVVEVVSVTRVFGVGMRSSDITYMNRAMLRDAADCDDALNITFMPIRADLHELIYTAIPQYIEAFDAYLVEYFDDQLFELDDNPRDEQGRPVFVYKGELYINKRYQVNRVGLVSYYDERLCRSAFGLSPAEVMARLEGKIEHARLHHNGVYLVGSSKLLPFYEAQELCRAMTDALIP